MKKLITAALSLVVLAAVIGGGFLVLGNSSAQAKDADPDIVVILRGDGVPVDNPDGVLGTCLETDLFDAHTNRLIGTGIDCLVFVEISEDETMFSIERTTVFNMPEGRLVARGLTTVVPIFGGSSPDFTHVVGDVDDATDNIVSGTKRFKNATGSVRLSGIVNLSTFPNSIGFNCIFIIDLD
ncbi:MAG: hypothetical protein IIC83_01025 [Chloroflexi bacterium]|nr:hypothetical protein [Chloroflexota bacterium]